MVYSPVKPFIRFLKWPRNGPNYGVRYSIASARVMPVSGLVARSIWERAGYSPHLEATTAPA